jgi:hypothetical protein
MHESDWSLTPDGFPLRTVLGMSLVDVAPVDDPAYYDTSTGLRSLAEARSLDVAEVEQLARENRLTELIKPAVEVFDLGGSKNSGQEGQGETHPSGQVSVLLRALDLKKQL